MSTREAQPAAHQRTRSELLAAREQAKKLEEQAKKLEEYIEKIHYSERYSDDLYEYRHVILPKPLLKMIPKSYFEDPSRPEVLRLLTEDEWRSIGITQSLGWEHYEVHAPEPHVLLFRRTKTDTQPTTLVNGKPKKK